VNEPSWRKPTGIFLILLLILVWAVIVATASSWIGDQHMLVQLLIYVVAGIVWIAPLKPLLAWMETGRWRP
jgi:predicted membrane channel-forming protein YqfA (hemolysin III family)